LSLFTSLEQLRKKPIEHSFKKASDGKGNHYPLELGLQVSKEENKGVLHSGIPLSYLIESQIQNGNAESFF
jgi:hypothetical protein